MQVSSVRSVYYAMGAEVDGWIGEILDALDRRGDRGSWYWSYISDHGEMAMEHRQTLKNTLYEVVRC